MLKGFKAFLSRGNVLDLAIAVIIGAAFNSVVKSLVEDIFTPLLGMLGGLPDFSSWKVGPLMLGSFVNSLLSFLFTAAVIYFVLVAPAEALKNAAKENKELKLWTKLQRRHLKKSSYFDALWNCLKRNEVR